jgi:hypothetical protein
LLRRCRRWNYEADNSEIYSRSHCCRPAQGCLDTPSFYNGTRPGKHENGTSELHLTRATI